MTFDRNADKKKSYNKDSVFIDVFSLTLETEVTYECSGHPFAVYRHTHRMHSRVGPANVGVPQESRIKVNDVYIFIDSI